jgi:outer membrane lipoprotein carrier protein
MKTIFILLLSVIFQASLLPQDDPAAIKVLDQFSTTAREAPSVSMGFTIITIDAIEHRRDTIEGSVVLSGNKYKLILPESTTWFNGTDSWNYMPSVKEVTITKPDPNEVSFFSKPSLLYTMHREGYKAKMVEEKASEYVVDLYPDDIKSDMVRIRLVISRPGMVLKSAEYKTRNGITMQMTTTDYTLKFRPDNSFFVFDSAKYKGVEVIDMR